MFEAARRLTTNETPDVKVDAKDLRRHSAESITNKVFSDLCIETSFGATHHEHTKRH